MLLSEKVTFAMVFLTILFILISVDRGLEVFIVLILIGVLINRELIDMFAPVNLKRRINWVIYTGLILFSVIVIRKLVEMLIDLFW